MNKARRRVLHRRTETLLRKVVELSRDVEAEFGKSDDRTIFAKNANCELYELRNMLVVKPAR
jgi:hypothetical protein